MGGEQQMPHAELQRRLGEARQRAGDAGERQDAADIAECHRERHLPLRLAHGGADRGSGGAGVGLHEARESVIDGRVGAMRGDPQQGLRFAQGEAGEVVAVAADGAQHRRRGGRATGSPWGGHRLEPLHKPIGRGRVRRLRPAIGPAIGAICIRHAARGWA